MSVNHILSFLVLCLGLEVLFFIDKLEKLQTTYESLSSCSGQDGEWSEWGQWSSCSSTCGGGMRSRSRSCSSTKLSTQNILHVCTGDSTQYGPCREKTCPAIVSVFSASYPKSVSSSETEYKLKKYSTVHINEGGDFNSDTGLFTCSNPGVYYFTATLIKKRADFKSKVDLVQCYIYKNKSPQILLFVDPTDDETDIGQAAVTNSIALRLDRGDLVYLGWCDDPNRSIEKWSSFTGFLLYPDV